MGRQNFRTYTIGLIAGQDSTLNVDGDMYAVTESGGPFSITFDDTNRIGDAIAGTGANFRSPYRRVVMHSATNQTVKIIMGFGEYRDSRATANVTVNSTFAPGNTFAGVPDVALSAGVATLVRAADADALTVSIKNPSSNTASIRIGGAASVGAAQGKEIEPGESYDVSTTDAIWAYSAVAQSVSLSAVRDV